MDQFPVDWLGRCGPHQIVVDCLPQQIRDRLKRSMMPDSLVNSLLAEGRCFSGWIGDMRFVIYPIFGRRPRPNLTGKLVEVDGGTSVEFTIEIDAMVSTFLILMPFILIVLIFFPFVATLAI